MEDYTIARDAYGNHYLCHGIEWKNHKYIKKIGEGKKALYFYTSEELKKYLQRLHSKPGENIDHLKTELLGVNKSDATKRGLADVAESIQQTAKNAKQTIGEKVKQYSEKREQQELDRAKTTVEKMKGAASTTHIYNGVLLETDPQLRKNADVVVKKAEEILDKYEKASDKKERDVYEKQLKEVNKAFDELYDRASEYATSKEGRPLYDAVAKKQEKVVAAEKQLQDLKSQRSYYKSINGMERYNDLLSAANEQYQDAYSNYQTAVNALHENSPIYDEASWQFYLAYICSSVEYHQSK